MPTLFLRLLAHDDKPAALADAVQRLREGQPCPDAYAVEPESFRQVPGAPFAYLVSERIRNYFNSMQVFESEGRTARGGAKTLDDLRFLRTFWEVSPCRIGPNHTWTRFSKGGSFCLYYYDVHLVIDWEDNGSRMREFYSIRSAGESWGGFSRSEEYYFRPGITWPSRTSKLSFRTLPSGCIFSIKGCAAFIAGDNSETILRYLGLMNSVAFRFFVSLQTGSTQLAQTFEVGVVRRTPVPEESCSGLALHTLRAINIQREKECSSETNSLFRLPALLQVPGATLSERVAAWQTREADSEHQLAELQREIDDIAFRLYGIDGEDRRAIEAGAGTRPTVDGEDEAGEEDEEPDAGTATDARSLVVALVSYAVGAVFGRRDLRYATGERTPPELPDPFAPLPVCSPGMLQGPDGLPPASAPEDYPLRIDADGLLVDDPDHPDDLIRRVRDVLEVIWKDRAEAIEQEACEIIGVATLRDYFRKPGPGGFWDDHIKRYSKSRRKAPIYWLLQSSRKNYALWIDYHRLDKDILFKALLNYVEPKVRLVSSQLTATRGQLQQATDDGQRKTDKKRAKEAERLEGFLSELQDFEDRLRRAANLHLEPDLNDGVVLNIAPLWEFVPWKEARSYWQELMDGKYEWSSIGKQLREKGLVKG